MSQHDRYISPFSTRYSSDEMQYIFSDDNKFRTWRRLWVALARAEMEQGLTNITPDMVAELEECRISTDKVYSNFLCSFIKRLCYRYIILRLLTGRASDKSYRCN